MDLVTFLRGQLDEDERWARSPECDQDPDRLLREVEAKRRIVDEYERQVRRSQENAEEHARISRGGWDDRLTNLRTHGWELDGRVAALLFAVQTLAAAHSDHPDYRKEWKP